MVHYLTSGATYIYKISCSKRVATNSSCRFHVNYLECWIILDKRWRPNRRFSELTEDERKLLLKIQKRLHHFDTWISLTKFWRVSRDSLFSRSSRHKVQIFLQQNTRKIGRPNEYAKDYINAVLRTALIREILQDL